MGHLPDVPAGPGRWILLGRILPRRTRERVFEPAFYDLLKRTLRSQQGATARFGGHAIGIFAGSFAIGTLRFLTSHRMLATGVVMSVFLITLLVALRGWIVDLYQGTPPY